MLLRLLHRGAVPPLPPGLGSRQCLACQGCTNNIRKQSHIPERAKKLKQTIGALGFLCQSTQLQNRNNVFQSLGIKYITRPGLVSKSKGWVGGFVFSFKSFPELAAQFIPQAFDVFLPFFLLLRTEPTLRVLVCRFPTTSGSRARLIWCYHPVLGFGGQVDNDMSCSRRSI